VLRQAPGRASIYYKLGRISATKGFKSDAKKNFLEYADRMQKAGQIDEAFRALKGSPTCARTRTTSGCCSRSS
jgi:hypothetical protein